MLGTWMFAERSATLPSTAPPTSLGEGVAMSPPLMRHVSKLQGPLARHDDWSCRTPSPFVAGAPRRARHLVRPNNGKRPPTGRPLLSYAPQSLHAVLLPPRSTAPVQCTPPPHGGSGPLSRSIAAVPCGPRHMASRRPPNPSPAGPSLPLHWRFQSVFPSSCGRRTTLTVMRRASSFVSTLACIASASLSRE
jgi:hypothetical protein